MTDFAAHYLLGSPLASLVGKDKGDLANRGRCAGSQVLNNAQTLVEDTVVIGGAAITAKAASKSPTLMKTLTKGFDKIVNVFKKAKYPGKVGEKITKYTDKLLKMGSKGKALAMIALPATMLLSYFGYKNIYKSGQIDQRYTDKAKIERATNKDLGL